MNSKNNTVDESQLDDLAPCPFCLGPGQSDFIVDTSYIIECYCCGARTDSQDGPAEAVQAWNRRGAHVSDEDFAAIVKRYEDVGDQVNADIIRKQWAVARARAPATHQPHAAMYQPAGVVYQPAAADVQNEQESDRQLPGEFSSAEALFDAMGVGDEAIATGQAQSVGTLAAQPAQNDLSEMLLAAQDMNEQLGSTLLALQKMQATEVVSVMLWLYRRLPRGYGRPPHIEVVIERQAQKAGMDVSECLAERGPGQNENKTNGVTDERT